MRKQRQPVRSGGSYTKIHFACAGTSTAGSGSGGAGVGAGGGAGGGGGEERGIGREKKAGPGLVA